MPRSRVATIVWCLASASLLLLVAATGDDDVVQAAAVAEGLDCHRCPDVVAPVCAAMPTGLRVTLSHRCLAICQGLTDIVFGNCEDAFNAALLEEHAAAAAGAGPAHKPLLLKSRRFQSPSATSKCRPSLKDMKKYAAEGAVFVGCAATSDKPGPDEAVTAAASAGEDAPVSASAAVAAAPADHVVVVTGHMVETNTRFLYIKAKTMTAEEARSALSDLPTRTGTKRAPAPEVWDKAQMKRVRRSSSADADEVVAAAAAEQPGEASIVSEVSDDDASLEAAPITGPGNRKLRLMTDNRWPVVSTTAWPWPAMVLLYYQKKAGGFGCSGTIISPDDVLTAAHCVIDSVTGEQYGSYTVIPGSNGATEPYGRFGVSRAWWWGFWVGAPYDANQGVAAGSTFADVAFLDLDRPVTWWQGIGGSSCGQRSLNIRACGYPAEKGWKPWCGDGTTAALDMCDTVYDRPISWNVRTTGGQSGGPVFNRDTGRVAAVVSGGSDDTSVYAPLDNFNLKLLFEPSWRTTLWSISRAFRLSYGPVRSGMNSKCLDVSTWGNGQRATVWDCWGGESQQWMRPSVGDLRLRVGAASRNKCLDVAGARKDNGAPVIIWDCLNTGDNQRWIADREGRLRPQHARTNAWTLPAPTTTMAHSWSSGTVVA